MTVFYVYEDWTTEPVSRCFYVGKGLRLRVGQRQRNKKHTNVANKYGCRREIVFATSVETLALERETELIAEHRTYVEDTDVGCNFTRGGEGRVGPGRCWTDEERQRQRDLLKTKNLKRSEATRQKISESKRGAKNGNFGKKRSPETIAKMCEAWERRKQRSVRASTPEVS